ncbi:Putative two-component system response regulator [Minicystis rosea]|nr:Putative two-component system response regulator [Minicystis rosea]
MAPRTVRVAIIDGHLLFRQGLRALLASQSDMMVVADAADASALGTADLAPDVVIVDVGHGPGDRLATTREALHRCHACRVLALAGAPDEDLSTRAFAAGASGFARKDQDAAEVVAAIRAVAGGERYVAPGTSDPRDGTARPATTPACLADLSPREREVFDLVVQGRSNRGMAERLRISIKTIEAHRTSINRKLSAHSTADLVRLAARHGLLPIHGS